jgi:hypothetical protein|tara:strand:+ start:836 stop:1870 length:1035 start_codon:yes stop_codon:yes gene_type:complete
MKLTPGELYFIGEDDPDEGSRTPFVKIGIVKEHEDRSIDDRLGEHQTGNPRRLRELHIEASPAVERIETLLHAEFAPCRVGGEWFHLPDPELEMVIERATVHINEATAGLPELQAAENLNAKMSNGQRLTPDSATLGLHRRLLDVRTQVVEAEGMVERIREALVEAAGGVTEGSPYFRVELRAGRTNFDGTAFTAAYPELAERYTIERNAVSRRFGLFGQKNHVCDVREDNPALFRHLAEVKRSLEAGEPPGELHRQYLELLALRGPLDWEQDLLEARLRFVCQEHEEVVGVCRWKREAVTRQTLDTTVLRNEQSDLYEQFLSKDEDKPLAIVNRHLGYRLPPG